MFSTVSDSVMTPVESFTPTDTSTYAESILTSVASPISTSADYTDTSYDSYYPPSSYSPHLSSVSYTDSYSYSYSDSGESSSTPTVVTIPVETDETIIVMRHSTTYTIVDGATVTSDFSAKGTGTGTGTGTGSISYTETGVWKNTTTSRKHTRTTRKATTTSESSITIDGYITGWSWTPVSDDPAMRTWEAVRRDEGDALGAEDDCEDYESENQVDLE
ncbi:hypothetical protein QBC34DRAFT_412524 [Podospora aff. communis PSN243]|uniref:Uncharacterized protein n=1 Tax=Podospora aff. communis PSN243 TaxID=3040156 RepID=A0AAV9GAT3_9PEZI|nr:hypothetical protein QBC34DRAFT_412524 [Podospora aff. communis PSN243]